MIGNTGKNLAQLTLGDEEAAKLKENYLDLDTNDFPQVLLEKEKNLIMFLRLVGLKQRIQLLVIILLVV